MFLSCFIVIQLIHAVGHLRNVVCYLFFKIFIESLSVNDESCEIHNFQTFNLIAIKLKDFKCIEKQHVG